MKTRALISLLLITLMAALMPSCGGKNTIDPEPEPEIEVLIDTTIIVDPYKSSTRFSILSHYRWTAEVTSGAYWCHLEPKEGGRGGATIAVKCDENDEFMVRQAHIQFHSEAGTGSITVIQQQIDVLDVTTGGECDFGPEGGSFAVDVGYNIDYDYTISADWVREIETRALLHSNKTFFVDKNNSGADRSCEIKFTAEGFEQVITVNQKPAYIRLSLDEVALEASLDGFPVMVESNVSYTATPQSSGWLSVAGETEAGTDGQLTTTGFELSLEENDSWFIREGEVVFGNPDYNLACPLHILQKAVDIIYASLPMLEFSSAGGEFEFDLDPTQEYEFYLEGGSWLTLSPVEGFPARRVIKVAKNTTGEERLASVTIIRGKAKKTLDIKQLGANPKFTPSKLEFTTEGGSLFLGVEGGVEYQLLVPEDAQWCSVTAVEGGYTVTATANELETSRTCLLTFVNEEYGVRATVEVVQAQLDAFIVSPLEFSFGPEGGRAELDIHANLEYGFEISEPEWIAEAEEEHTPTRRVYTVALNDTGHSRQGSIHFAAEGYEYTVSITQQGAFVTASEHSFTFDDAAASGSFTVDANIQYTAGTPDCDWITLDISEAGKVAFFAEENNEWGNRSARIVIGSDVFSAADTVTVFQGAKFYLDIEQMEFDLPPQGGLAEIKVSSNKDYTYHIDGTPDWITEVRPLVFEAAANKGSQAREAQIIFEQNGLSKSVSIVQDAPLLMVEPSLLEFSSDGGEGAFTINANIDFTVSDPGAEWCVLTRTGINAYSVSLTPSQEFEMRECVISVGSEEFGLQQEVTVRQAQLDVFEIGNTRFEFPPQGGEADVEIYTNMACSATVGADWVSESAPGSYIIAKNDSGKVRECIIEFVAGEKKVPVTVVQAAAVLQADKVWLDFPISGGTLTFTVTANIDYELIMPDADWIACNAAGAGVYEVTVPANITEQARSCAITLQGVGFSASATVNAGQEKMDFFEISTTEFDVSPAGGVVSVPLRSNIQYTYTIGQNWISGGGIDFTVDKNEGSQARECTVVYSAGGATYTVTFRQEAPSLIVEVPQTEFSPDGGETSLTVKTNLEYEIDVPGTDWLTCTGGEGGIYAITVADNEVDEPRECTIAVTAAGFDIFSEVTIHQGPRPVFDMAQTEYSLGPEGGAVPLQVRTNLDYTYSVDADWIADTGDLQFEVPLNDTGEDRECSIVFMAGGETYTVTVTQAAASLELDTESVELEQTGGSFQVNVTSNVPYEITMPDEDWLSLRDGEEGGEYEFDVAEHTGYRWRRCSIVFSAPDYGISRTVAVAQYGPPEPFAIEKRDHYAGPCDTRLVIKHTEVEELNVSIYNADWIRELEGESTPTGIVFELDTLFGSSTRQAMVTIVGDGTAKTAFVFQNPPRINIFKDDKQVVPEGGTVPVTIVTNFRPDCFVEDDWISARLNEAGDRVEVTVVPNDTGLDRTAVVRVGSERLNYFQEFSISQRGGGRCNFSPASYEIAGEGGEFYVTVEANVDYYTVCKHPWVTCTKTAEEDVLLVKVLANTSAYLRSSGVVFNYDGRSSTLEITQEGLRNPDYYYTEDFSRDGNVVQLQQASRGNGIPLVLMGDAYTDRLIEDGKYASDINRAVEAFFSIEPFTSFRDFFNIYMVEVVSQNEVYEDDALRALSTQYQAGKSVKGDDGTVMSYALNAIDQSMINASLVIVLMNIEAYGGTTYLNAAFSEGTYGLGRAISYVPLCTGEDEFTAVLQHEAGGHGFGKLEDEYGYEALGEIPTEKITQIRQMQSNGYYKNVDFTSDPEQVLWSKFISDEDYQYDGVGVFEGACTYATGAYRATENSMMRYNDGPFNAPSREAIYFRLHKLAYGDSWVYDFDAFKQYDAINRTPAPEEEPGEGSGRGSGRDYSTGKHGVKRPPLPHPIIVER